MAVQNRAKRRTLYYRRASWHSGSGNLQQHLTAAHHSLATTANRTFPHGEGEIQGASWDKSNSSGGLLFHVADYVPQQPTSLIPLPSQSQKIVSTLESLPPTDNNYMLGDIFGLVVGNHMILCPSGLREETAMAYVSYMLSNGIDEQLPTKYELTPVADIDKTKYIKKHGVKSFELSSSLYEATVDYIDRRSVKERLMHGISNEFLALFANDPKSELHDISDKENLQVKLIISFDKRKTGEIGQERLIKASTQSLQSSSRDGHDNEGFRIVTGNGQTLSHEQIRLSQKFDIEPFGNSVFRASAWEALETYYEQLREDGTLQQ